MSIGFVKIIYNDYDKNTNIDLFIMPKENIMIYRRIRDLREDADMTQTQIAAILHCSQRVYSNYERGDIDIPTEILIKLADFHNVSVDYLLGRTDKKETNK